MSLASNISLITNIMIHIKNIYAFGSDTKSSDEELQEEVNEMVGDGHLVSLSGAGEYEWRVVWQD